MTRRPENMDGIPLDEVDAMDTVPTCTAMRHEDGPLPRDYALRVRRRRERLAFWLLVIAIVGCVALIIAPGAVALVAGKL